jgi:hypothetical protein
VSEVLTYRNFLHRIESSDRFNHCEDFLGIFGYVYSSPYKHHQDPFTLKMVAISIGAVDAITRPKNTFIGAGRLLQ